MRPPEFDRNGADVAQDMISCLSIRQPYAWLIVQGIKPVENRTWSTKFRGRVLIHAGITYAKRAHRDDLNVWGPLRYPRNREAMIGGIVGEAVIVDCVRQHPSEFFFGPYGFVLEQPRAYRRLIPFGGRLGFFGVPARLLDGHEFPDEAHPPVAPDGDGHCKRCGLPFEEPAELEHECPAGFRS